MTATLTGPATRTTPGAPPVIDLRGGRKTYTTGSIMFEALRGVDVRIERGEYVAIMGPSGSGKSTLMNVLGCLDVLTSGTYRLAGHDVGDLDEVELAQIRNEEIGFVFQQFHLLPSLASWRNVELPLMYRGVARNERRDRAAAALERVGLGDRLDNRPGELSGGQQQRVAVARALVGEPALILADEPTGNLDTASTEDVLALFDELHGQGRTIVLITHEPEVAERARRVVRVRDGLIQGDGPASALHDDRGYLHHDAPAAAPAAPSTTLRTDDTQELR
ncbi:ABC transporter ATP-binding protein [Luteimicrobium sp. NPDC057192]|uniref:ABC transporter ATP-binding protein n=1 Tax=Luteimicrobium sp. NPDC057192 TaxID=3346042 RepID=UPI00363A177E